ncbi:hypothetical protein GH714_033837 [Hevea brasiliensis]|uniref:Uncharacterized protein n=1 Tax=Hevea brasiliensis TaxID=3981 RepID=A0A6A6N8C7_HEVBR|nr:hypothetical protein GH714_033837 [Hevea brasiliensis]
MERNPCFLLVFFLILSCFVAESYGAKEGPGCSSLAYGAMEELGPFRVHSDGKTLYNNNFHGMRIGNAVINDETDNLGMYDYYGNHALTSPETVQKIHQYCNFSPDFVSKQSRECNLASGKADHDTADIDIYNIYWPLCHNGNLTAKPKQASLAYFDPCSDYYVHAYFNTPEEFMANGLRVWIYSGDTDGRVPVTSTQYSIAKMKLPTKTEWYPWYLNGEVGGYSQVYQGDLTFVTVRGAGHQVPSYQPERSLSMIKHFLSGNPLPKGSSSQRPFATVGLQQCTKL